MLKYPFLFTAIFLLLFNSAESQNRVFKMEGIVHGVEQGASQGFFKKRKPTTLQGSLDNVKIDIYVKDKLFIQTSTDHNGTYHVNLQFDELYHLIVSKEGYNKNEIYVDTRAFPSKIKSGGFLFTGAEFILSSKEGDGIPDPDVKIGRIYYSPSSDQFFLEPFKDNQPTGFFGPPTTSNVFASTEIFERAILRNSDKLKNYAPLQQPIGRPLSSRPNTLVPKPSNNGNYQPKASEAVKEATHPTLVHSDELTIPREFNLSTRIERPDNELIRIQEDAIRREKEQLEIYRLLSRTQRDSLEIIRREEQIALAEKNILDARFLITNQQEKIAAQQDKMYLLVCLLIVLSGTSFLTFSYFRQRQKVSQLIESKNRQITDSISYARRIQQSILISEDTLQQFFPESFVFLQPKAIVSGDFYFIATIQNKIIVAVADCTGHGVPGAFMSLIGYRLLREIVVEKAIYDPALVLEKLHTGINESLNQKEDNENSQDGMDIAVCLIDPVAHTLVFAGAMNPAYLVFDQELQVLQADVSSVGGKTLRPRNENEIKKFSTKASQYNPGCMLYLFTDGYMDQFGGEQDQKFNTRRFKQMLMDIQPLSAMEQKEVITGTLKEWKRESAQTDDILMLGIRL